MKKKSEDVAKDFERVINYRFKNRTLLNRALTHSSYDFDNCNERLEFLGDSILNMVTAVYLYSGLPLIAEGKLSRLRAALVCENALFEFGKRIDLGERIHLGQGEIALNGRERPSIVSDAFEAVIAAIYLDGGFDAARDFILSFFPSPESMNIEEMCTDFKTALQEWAQENTSRQLEYAVVSEKGEPHMKTFVCSVTVNGVLYGTGTGRSKKVAEQNAAKEALIKLNRLGG